MVLGRFVVLSPILVVTVVGALLVVQIALGAAIAYLATGDRLVGRGEGWPEPLVVGSAIDAVAALAVDAGFGAILRDLVRPAEF